jgi:hypothetical protein
MKLYIKPTSTGFDCCLVKNEVIERHIHLEKMSIVEVGDVLDELLEDVFGVYELELVK